MSFFLGETDELFGSEGDFVRVKGEKGFGGIVFEGSDDFWHGIEHA
jgi:hypothetical protein